MKLGERAELIRTFTAEDLAGYSCLASAPAGRHVPEPLIAALFSYLLGVRLPGPGTNYLKQEIAFLGPVPIGKPLIASVEVTRLRPDKQIADLWACAQLKNGTVVAEGRSLVKYADTGHG